MVKKIAKVLLILMIFMGASQFLQQNEAPLSNAETFSKVNTFKNAPLEGFDGKKNSRFNQESFREMVLSLISSSPGIHYNALCRKLNSKNGVTQYHLSVLEKTNQIKSIKDGGYRRYFPNRIEFSHPQSMTIISALHRKSTNSILYFLFHTSSPLSRTNLAKLRNSSPQAVSAACGRLEQQNLITSNLINKKKFYSLSNEMKLLIEGLVKKITINNFK